VTTSDVSVVTENLPGSRVGLSIEVPQAQVDSTYERVLQRLSQRVRIGGFRPGKAPRALVEARLGPTAIREEVIDALVPPVVNQALRDREIDAIDRPDVEIQELERGRPARFIAKVSVWPSVTLADLGSLQLERPVTEVTDETVERRLLELRERLAEVEPVEREAALGDIAVADVRLMVEDQEVPSETRTAVELELKEGVLVPELLAVLPGRKAGEVAVAEVTMPEDHDNEDVRGKPGRLEVTVQGVKQKTIPELTDELAVQLSDGQRQTVEELRAGVREDLVEQARRIDELAFEQQVVKSVVEASQVELPDSLVEREIDRQLEDMERRLSRQGLRMARYFEYLNKTEQEYRLDMREDAESRVKVDLVLEEAGRQLAMEPSDEEVTEYMRDQADKDAELKEQLEQLSGNEAARGYFRHRLTRIKVLEGLVSRLDGKQTEAKAEAKAE
jgi:trigger factor